MDGYLGTFPVDIKDTEFAKYTPTDWALYFIGSYGQIDGSHHKLWVLDQVARILHGTQVIVTERRWADGHKEFDTNVAVEPSQSYLDWVVEMKGDWDEEYQEFTYEYDVGMPP